jgi:ribosome-binding protein aMBF1 (putative translation factor)
VEAKDGSRTFDRDSRTLDTVRAALKLIGLEPLLKLTQIHGDVREREPPTEHFHRRLAANPNVAPRKVCVYAARVGLSQRHVRARAIRRRAARRAARGSTRNNHGMGQGEAGYAETVRAAREAAGKDPGELAAALDMSYESYRDIESYDDEITSVVSFREAVTLADLLELDLRSMFGADDTVVTFAELADALRERLGETLLEQLENELGWELADALADPAAFAEFSLDGLADIAGPFGLGWRHLLPVARRRGE